MRARLTSLGVLVALTAFPGLAMANGAANCGWFFSGCPWPAPFCPVCPVVVCAASAAPSPADLDVKNLNPIKKIPSEAVGGGDVAEGFVTSYGAFRLGKGKHEGMIMGQNASEPRGFFNQVKLAYVGEHKDPGTGATGSLYRTAFADGQERYYFFGNQDLPCNNGGPRQRQVIAFDGSGRVLHSVAANYARALK